MCYMCVLVVVERVSSTYNQSTREKRVRPRNGDPRRRYDRERATESQKLRQVLELLSFSFFLCFLPGATTGVQSRFFDFCEYLFG